MEQKKLKLTFAGGTGSVTGANFLLEGEGKRFLIDCGLEQGTKLADESNWEDFSYDAQTIDILFITHAHIDHIGRIPKLIAAGFRGKIYSSRSTMALARPMLEDTAQILAHSKDARVLEWYAKENIDRALLLWEGFDFHQEVTLDDNFSVTLYEAGHILGSTMYVFTYNGKRIMFTGDLGNSPSPILKDTDIPENIDYLIMESVYGDRNHEHRDDRQKMLEQIIRENYERRGTLVIPTFSLERTQELLFEIDTLVEAKKIPTMPVYLDSPLAVKVTSVYREYESELNATAQGFITGGDDIFKFPGLKVTRDAEDSKHILKESNPKIIIAGSGMSNGGRVIHHEQNYLPDANNTLLLTGYQAPGTMGRMIEEGATSVHILGEEVPVRAHIETIFGYSGHKDSDHLVLFVEAMKAKLSQVYVVMGEPKSSLFLAQRLRDSLGIAVATPEKGDSTFLNC